MTCDDCRALFAAGHPGRLLPSERMAVRRHVLACGDCSRLLWALTSGPGPTAEEVAGWQGEGARLLAEDLARGDPEVMSPAEAAEADAARRLADPGRDLTLYVVYDRPDDFPDLVVVRRWALAGATMTPEAEPFATAGTLEEARALLPAGLTRLARDPADDPIIVETWL